MPIKIPNDLPARQTLEAEGVMVMSEATALRQDIRPLHIGLLNLMPDKIKTETQFARLIGASPLQIELTLIKLTNHQPKNTPAEHMLAFYHEWQEIKDQKFDGLIVTGAPVEHMAYEEVGYWQELTHIFDWAPRHVHSSLFICWSAQAAFYHFHQVPKFGLACKAFGAYPHCVLNRSSPYLRGFSDEVIIPVSRWTEVRLGDIPKDRNLEILLAAQETGLCLIADEDNRALYMFNHIEYDTRSLGDEYHRDIQAHKVVALPVNYFPQNNAEATPINSWRSHAHLLFGNWINQVYQTTPFDLKEIGIDKD